MRNNAHNKFSSSALRLGICEKKTDNIWINEIYLEVVAKSRVYNHKKKTSDSWGTKFSSKFAKTKSYWNYIFKYWDGVILGCIHKIFKSTLVDIANSEENKYMAERLIYLENIAKSSISINNIKTTFFLVEGNIQNSIIP